MPSTVKRKKPSVKKTLPVPDLTTYNMSQPVIQPRSSTNPLLILVLLVLAFGAGYFFFKSQSLEKAQTTQTTNTQQPSAPDLKLSTKPSTSEHWKGDKNARIVMVEYTDLECPFCKQIHPSLQKLWNENGGNVAWIIRHYPLSFHPKAQKSAESAECVADQASDEGFFKMVDAIYERMPTLELSELPALASSLGYDESAVKTCMDSNKYERKVKAEQEEGVKTGVRATPTTVFYDMKTGKSKTAEGALPYEQLKTMLDELKKG